MPCRGAFHCTKTAGPLDETAALAYNYRASAHSTAAGRRPMLGGRWQLSLAVDAGSGDWDRSSLRGGVYSIGRDIPVYVLSGFGRRTEVITSDDAQ